MVMNINSACGVEWKVEGTSVGTRGIQLNGDQPFTCVFLCAHEQEH